MSASEKAAYTIVPRITQLDAVEFDDNIRDLLGGQLVDIGKYLKPGTLSPVKPELQLLTDVLIFRASLLKHGGTFGQQLLNLKYGQTLNEKSSYLYLLFNVVLPYFKHRYDESWRGDFRNVNILVNGFWNVGKLLQFINILLFLREGAYPTLTDRILGLKYVHAKKASRSVVYNYMIRELLWHSFMELVMFSLPLVNAQAIKRKLKSMFSKPSSRTQVSAPILNLKSICAVCQLRPNTPCRISLYCKHVACYLCLKGSIMADEKFLCPECSAVNTAVRHFQYITC